MSFWENSDEDFGYAQTTSGEIAQVMPASITVQSKVGVYRPPGSMYSNQKCASDGCDDGEVVWSTGGGDPHTCWKHARDSNGNKTGEIVWGNTSEATVKCSVISPRDDCPVFGSAVASVTPINAPTLPTNSIICDYATSNITASCANTSAFINYMRDRQGDPSFFNDDFMKEMCSNQADPASCPDKTSMYRDSLGRIVCSNMIACQMCREWSVGSNASAAGMKIADQVMKGWCDKHSTVGETNDPTKSDPACQCINKAYNPVVSRFQDAQEKSVKDDPFKAVDPLCWFTPCSIDRQLARYLVPSDERAPTCPSSICAEVIDFANNSDISADDMKQYMNCNGTTPVPDPDKDVKTGNYWSNLSSAQKAAIIGGGVTAGAIIIAMGYLLIRKGGKPKMK